MDYYQYPIKNSPFTSKSNNNQLFTTDKGGNNCFPTQGYQESCQPNVIYGYHKPLNEKCPIITGNLNYGPDNGCMSPWNNMTKRKSLVKDY